MKFKKGQIVIEKFIFAGEVTQVEKEISKVSKAKNQVWLSNGDGNSPSGPFDGDTGLLLDNFLGTKRIVAKEYFYGFNTMGKRWSLL